MWLSRETMEVLKPVQGVAFLGEITTLATCVPELTGTTRLGEMLGSRYFQMRRLEWGLWWRTCKLTAISRKPLGERLQLGHQARMAIILQDMQPRFPIGQA